MQHVDAVGDAEALRIGACEADGVLARVRRPDLDVRLPHGERDCDRAAAGADVGDAHRDPVDLLQRGVDERFRRRARREDASGRSLDREVMERCFHKLRP